jgi:aromatic-L-amino-acid/L-tryptophan decarboxylase
VEHAVELAGRLADKITERGWSVVNEPALAVVCMEPPEGSVTVREIVRRILESGRAWVSVAKFEGRDVVRACVTHGETSHADIDDVADLLVRTGHFETR